MSKSYYLKLSQLVTFKQKYLQQFFSLIFRFPVLSTIQDHQPLSKAKAQISNEILTLSDSRLLLPSSQLFDLNKSVIKYFSKLMRSSIPSLLLTIGSWWSPSHFPSEMCYISCPVLSNFLVSAHQLPSFLLIARTLPFNLFQRWMTARILPTIDSYR